MLSSISNWVEDKATGYLKTGIQAGGTLAGNAVGGVGSLVESAGKSAASGVQGGIGGVGGYINGYGDSIKRSMSSDGPVSSAQKKTAVKPSAPAGKPPSAAKAQPPSTLPAKKALPAPAQKGPATPKPATRTPPAKSNQPAPTSKPAGPTSVKSKGPVGVTKPATHGTKPVSNVNSSGKTMVSPESRPGYRKAAVSRNNPNPMPAKGGDILGIGENFGKTGPKDSHNKNSSGGAARKPSASDPLAIGDLENVGKKK